MKIKIDQTPLISNFGPAATALGKNGMDIAREAKLSVATSYRIMAGYLTMNACNLIGAMRAVGFDTMRIDGDHVVFGKSDDQAHA